MLAQRRSEASGGGAPAIPTKKPPPRPPPRQLIELDTESESESESDDEVASPLPTPEPDEPRNFTITASEIEIGDKLGEGEFGEVKQGTLTRKGKRVSCAVKMIRPGSGDEGQTQDERLAEFTAESELMKGFDHPNVVKLFGQASDSNGMPMICMEILPLGELRVFIRQNQGVLRRTALTILYVYQVTLAMDYLQQKKIIHRDLAARNILVKDPTTVKVADFGLSRYCEGVYKFDGGRMPVKWMAPESVEKRIHTKKSDVWMYAVCCWEILSYGVKPFLALKNEAYLDAIRSGTRLEKPKGCPKGVFDALLGCWSVDPLQRPLFRELLGQIKVVLDMFAKQGKNDLTDDMWRRLGGQEREPTAPPPRPMSTPPGISKAPPRPPPTIGPKPVPAAPGAKNPFAKAPNPFARYPDKKANKKANRHSVPAATAPGAKSLDYMSLHKELGLIGLDGSGGGKGGMRPEMAAELGLIGVADGQPTERSREEFEADWAVDFAKGARSRTMKWVSPAGDVEWEIKAAAFLALEADERLSERIRFVMDHVLELKALHATADTMPGPVLKLVLKLGQDYNGVLDDARERIEGRDDYMWTHRMMKCVEQLATVFQLVLESMAEVVSNFGQADDKDLRAEVVSCCSKFTVCCMSLSNVAEGGNQSFGRFSRQTKTGVQSMAQYKAAVRELGW